MPDHRQIYLRQAADYQRLIAREDFQNNLLPAILRLAPEMASVVDLGSGTGRLACLLQPEASRVIALDRSHHMLLEAARQLHSQTGKACPTAAADHRAVPLAAGCADVVISGWSLCYLVVWDSENWKTSLGAAFREIQRLLVRNGLVIIIETLGTGELTPHVPDELADYYSFLEGEGFSHTWLRTDYRFQNRAEANQLVEFFFGLEMLDRIDDHPRPVLPECTGMWWRRIP